MAQWISEERSGRTVGGGLATWDMRAASDGSWSMRSWCLMSIIDSVIVELLLHTVGQSGHGSFLVGRPTSKGHSDDCSDRTRQETSSAFFFRQNRPLRIG